MDDSTEDDGEGHARWPLAGTYRRLGYYVDPTIPNEEPLNLLIHKVGPRLEWV